MRPVRRYIMRNNQMQLLVEVFPSRSLTKCPGGNDAADKCFNPAQTETVYARAALTYGGALRSKSIRNVVPSGRRKARIAFAAMPSQRWPGAHTRTYLGRPTGRSFSTRSLLFGLVALPLADALQLCRDTLVKALSILEGK